MADQLLLYEVAGYRCGAPLSEVLRVQEIPPGETAEAPAEGPESERPTDLAAVLHVEVESEAAGRRPLGADDRPSSLLGRSGGLSGGTAVLTLELGGERVAVRVSKVAGIISGTETPFLHIPGPLRDRTPGMLTGFYDIGDELVSRLDFRSLRTAS